MTYLNLIINKFVLLGLIAVGLIAIIFRFVSLEEFPPGFFVDEALCAAHTVCLKEYGVNCDGISWPMYSAAWGHGRVGPVYQYAGWVWTSVFGGTIFSLRAMSSFAGILAAFFVALIANIIAGRKVGYWVLFAALLSPWGFHSARLAWDPALGGAMLSLTVLLFFQALNKKRWYVYLAFAALCCMLCFHTYSPVGAQAFFLFTLIFLTQKLAVIHPWKHWFVFGAFTVLFFSSTYFMDTSLVQGRVGEVSIMGDDARNPTAGQPWTSRVPQFLSNISKHYDYSYLVTEGEFNLRHTVNGFGILSWVDIYAVVVGLLLLLALFLFRKNKVPSDNSVNTAGFRSVLILGFIGYLSAAMSAALTWDSLPHGLRSLAGWPFVALFSGACLAYINRFVLYRLATLVIAVLFITQFWGYYSGQFTHNASWWFDKDVTDNLKITAPVQDFESWDKFIKERQYPGQARRYFDVQYFNKELEFKN